MRFFIKPLRHIYSTLVILQITLTAVSIGAESQVFYFWTSESLLLHIQKHIFHEIDNTFETGPYLEHSVTFIKVVNKA